MNSIKCNEVVVVDFETTGLSPEYERIIEVGAAIIKDGKMVKSFSQLMNPGFLIPSFITGITGISNLMLKGKPSPEKVMPELKRFIGKRVILAHNASFDSKFLYSEMKRARLKIDNPIICTLLLSRRLMPNVTNYKLGTLANHLNYKIENAHRALDDVKATSIVWNHLYKQVQYFTGIQEPNAQIFTTIGQTPKGSIEKYFTQIRTGRKYQ